MAVFLRISACRYTVGFSFGKEFRMNTSGANKIQQKIREVIFSNAYLSSEMFSFAEENSCYAIFPGFVDVHVHLREPGYFYKESIATGTAAAAHGGYTEVCSMPNLSPVPDTLEHLQEQMRLIETDAVIGVHPYASITQGERGEVLSDFDALAPYVVGFSDDGRGVQNADLMLRAMQRAKALGKPIVAHCEDNTLLRGGYIHDGAYAAAHRHAGICAESEWGPIRRDLALVRETGCDYHVCHVSTKESVALIRQAKREGLHVTCETAPHYLVLDDSMLQEDGRFKMNPPIRSAEDREALLEGILDGTIDMIATDHAPHSEAEKAGGLQNSLMGVVGLETAFPVLYSRLVKPGILPLDWLISCLSDAPRKRFSLPLGNDFSLWDLGAAYTVNPTAFLSKGRATPFAGWEVNGKCILTVRNGKAVWYEEKGEE